MAKRLGKFYRDDEGISEVVGEFIILILSIVLASSLVATFKPPDVGYNYHKIVIRDSKQPASTGQVFDIVMLSGSIKYSDLRVVLRNATDGSLIDSAVYDGYAVRGNVIMANVSDIDSSFSTGDVLKFSGKLDEGEYEVFVVDENKVVVDMFIKIN
ncbi:hypothetical protein DRP05_04195 [Archaeoglobales archaeon]|nr:MAG: hypothetical protein DRP05_04195 [Archaeoglobales archaeon]